MSQGPKSTPHAKTKTTAPAKIKTTAPSKTKTTTKPSGDGAKMTRTSDGGAVVPGGGTTWKPTNPVAKKLSTKPSLLNKVTSRLPPNIDLNAATAGFERFGQFVAAVNVSNNLGIPFGDLKAAMTGTTLDGTPTGKPTRSLGQAIQQLKPGVNADGEALKAQLQANRDINAPARTKVAASRRSH